MLKKNWNIMLLVASGRRSGKCCLLPVASQIYSNYTELGSLEMTLCLRIKLLSVSHHSNNGLHEELIALLFPI